MNSMQTRMVLNQLPTAIHGNGHVINTRQMFASDEMGKINIADIEWTDLLVKGRCLMHIDTNGIVLQSNKREWFGYNISDNSKKKIPIWQWGWHRKATKNVRSNWDRWLLDGGKTKRCWMTCALEKQKMIPIEVQYIQSTLSIGNGHSFWLLITDLSPEWKVRSVLRARISEINKKIEQNILDFAAWLHDWKAPLSTIESSAWLCLKYKEELDDEKRNRHLRRIEKSVHEMKIGMQDWQTWHQPPSLRTIAKIDLRALVKERIQQLSPILKPGQIIRTFHQGGAEINTDQVALSHVLDNLLTNASKYSTDHTSIWVRTWNLKGILRIEITDEGVGIPPDEIKHLFEPRYRASNAKDTPGSGLGLSTVHRLIKQMDGDIQVISQINQGTTFSINLKNQQTHEKSTDHRRQRRNPR